MLRALSAPNSIEVSADQDFVPHGNDGADIAVDPVIAHEIRRRTNPAPHLRPRSADPDKYRGHTGGSHYWHISVRLFRVDPAAEKA